MSDIDFERKPGDMITAEDWNALQVAVKDGIQQGVATLRDEIKSGETTAKQAENAEHFATKSEREWLETLDGKYVQKSDLQEGESVYKRYIKRFTEQRNQVFLEHNADLCRLPLIDVYELDTVYVDSDSPGDTKVCKIFIYYGHSERKLHPNLVSEVYGRKIPVGMPLEKLLKELKVAYTPDSALEDVINDTWEAFMADPNDELDHCISQWISDKCNKKQCVGELRKKGYWDDIMVAIRPRKCGKGADSGNISCQVEITQVNYNTLHIQVPKTYFEIGIGGGVTEAGPPNLDLMFMLRF